MLKQVIKREFDIFPILPIFVFALFPITGISLLLFASSVNYFKCQRIEPNQGSCELTKVSSPFEWKDTQNFTLSQIKEASVITNSSRSSNYSDLVLTADYGDIRISMSGYTRAGVEEQANQINEFLKQPQQITVTIQQIDDRAGIYFIGTVFTVFPFYGLLWRYFNEKKNNS